MLPEVVFLPSFLSFLPPSLPPSATVFMSDASYFVLDESRKPRSLIEFSAISCDSMGGREQPVKASSGGVLDEWGETLGKIRL